MPSPFPEIDDNEITREICKMPQPFSIPRVPKEFAGKWIAWNFQRTTIVASGATFAEVRRAAEITGEPNPIFAKAPRANVRFLGGRR
jgi:hypothetical protein